jgi:hypothetical protein
MSLTKWMWILVPVTQVVCILSGAGVIIIVIDRLCWGIRKERTFRFLKFARVISHKSLCSICILGIAARGPRVEWRVCTILPNDEVWADLSLALPSLALPKQGGIHVD